jgi:trk system potassium uptake protein
MLFCGPGWKVCEPGTRLGQLQAVLIGEFVSFVIVSNFCGMFDRLKPAANGLRYIFLVTFWISLIAIVLVIYNHGIDHEAFTERFLLAVIMMVFAGALVSLFVRHFLIKPSPAFRVRVMDSLIVLFITGLMLEHASPLHLAFLDHWAFLYTGLFIVFFREFAALRSTPRFQYMNPAQLFVGTYIIIILLGALLLMLPNATFDGITFTDALFTSTSAFCITGLIVVDTATYFTLFGQIVIMILFQLGGIGIMTFTSFFSYVFAGATTFGNQYILKDMTSSEKMAEVFKTVRMIVLFTFLIEGIGALFIYMSLDRGIIASVEERVFFSIFHAVSGFCNAGFTTMSGNLYHEAFSFNYSLHLVIAFLFIIGGLGFAVTYNFYNYLKHYMMNRILRKRSIHVPWVIQLNTRIVVIASLVLLVGGTFFFYILEYNNALAEHGQAGKIITSFFGAATPRSAGFNTVDTSALLLPTLMLVMFLMWVGAGPGSTGGGIRVTTLAIAFMNVVSIARGKDRIEVYGRELSVISLRRAFAVILFSFIVIGLSVFAISLMEPGRELLPVAFECFSAYGTVGLSMGITGELTDGGKLVIILNMFVGRLNMIVIMLAILKKVMHLNYRFPEENLPVN